MKLNFNKEPVTDIVQIKQDLQYLLSLIVSDLPIFPINVMTYGGGQREVKKIEEILQIFKTARYIDCRINGYPVYTGYNGLNTTKKVMIMIDLDLFTFRKYKDPRKQLKISLKKMLKKFRQEINCNPTVLWTGGGYHIYQPICFKELLTGVQFNKYAEELNQNLSNLFMKFANWFFSDGKSDPNHHPSIKSCLLRVPGTINSKYNTTVSIIQKGDTNPIQLDIIDDIRRKSHEHIIIKFEDWLIQQKIDKKLDETKLLRNKRKIHLGNDKKILWIENLLNTPINDHRHYCLWKILIPYLVNVRGLREFDLVLKILSPWLNECDKLRILGIEPCRKINGIMKGVRNYLPITMNKMKEENRALYNMIKFID
ncbi:MAG TPA: hypothetical protein VFV86_07385 [Nitrososphaeraceae archaeon]|nr:hypothetical protein [Nitrososphaeraceae archaeon]